MPAQPLNQLSYLTVCFLLLNAFTLQTWGRKGPLVFPTFMDYYSTIWIGLKSIQIQNFPFYTKGQA